jgi:hypothetical protein
MSRYVEIYGSRYPAVWSICPCCNGEGKSSAYLGSFTSSEFDEAFDFEEQDAYFKGDYDRTCENCRGQGKVLEPDWERCNKQQREELTGIAEDRKTAEWERRMGC